MELSPEETAQWKRRLREEEVRLSRRFGVEEALLDDESDATQGNADDAAAWAEREGTKDFLLKLEEGQRDAFRAIADAWRRLDEGTFGVCDNCGEPIPKARLEAVPYATTCVKCAAQ